MPDTNQSELDALRKRAYGPRPDIHLDPHAVSRLQELESRSRPSSAASSRSDHDTVPVESPSAGVGDLVEGPHSAEDTQRKSIDWSWVRELLLRLVRMRRSTALIVLSAVVIVVLAMTALTLVQRVQVDPLQVGAEQIARLPVDPSYEVPEVMELSAGQGELEGFQDFYGLRAVGVLGGAEWFFGQGSGDCMSLFSEADMEFTPNGFGGVMMSGCGAGDFPAIIQLEITAESVPEELRTAYPESTAFQFVLDADNREIVVFMSQ